MPSAGRCPGWAFSPTGVGTVPELCEQLGLALQYFDFIVVSARVGCSKPNPCIFP